MPRPDPCSPMQSLRMRHGAQACQHTRHHNQSNRAHDELLLMSRRRTLPPESYARCRKLADLRRVHAHQPHKSRGEVAVVAEPQIHREERQRGFALLQAPYRLCQANLRPVLRERKAGRGMEHPREMPWRAGDRLRQSMQGHVLRVVLLNQSRRRPHDPRRAQNAFSIATQPCQRARAASDHTRKTCIAVTHHTRSVLSALGSTRRVDILVSAPPLRRES
jgi:hypothetical protein